MYKVHQMQEWDQVLIRVQTPKGAQHLTVSFSDGSWFVTPDSACTVRPAEAGTDSVIIDTPERGIS